MSYVRRIAVNTITQRNKEWQKERYKKFNEKIDYFKEHEKYSWLRRFADEAICYNAGGGYFTIKAADFIERIESMPTEYIKDWLDGKNQLEWKPEYRQRKE